jgi:predicted amidophosphoribosyltransferase
VFGFGKTFCVLCDHRVAKREASSFDGRADIAVCTVCQHKWHESGRLCARCKTPVAADNELGMFFDRYALGHVACGAVQLLSAPDVRLTQARLAG